MNQVSLNLKDPCSEDFSKKTLVKTPALTPDMSVSLEEYLRQVKECQAKREQEIKKSKCYES